MVMKGFLSPGLSSASTMFSWWMHLRRQEGQQGGLDRRPKGREHLDLHRLPSSI